MKRAVPVFLFAVLFVAFGFQVRSAEAWSTYSTNGSTGNCASCHGDFNAGGSYTSLADGQSWGANLHDVHRNTMLGGDCDTCHGSGGRSPVVLNSSVGGSGLSPISCVGCHGRNEDVTPNDGAFGGPGPGRGDGLRAHHAAAFVTVCAGCHNADTVPVGENVLPPYYANPGTGHPDMPTNPCKQNGNENFAGGPEGLDNDGDNVYDGADSDCASPQIDVNPMSKDYGNVAVGSSASQEFTVSNNGTADLVISDGVLSDETNYILDASIGATPCGDVPITITPSGSCTVSIAFSPLSPGTFPATVTVTSNDTTNSPLVVDLTGNGVSGPTPDISVTDSVAPNNDLDVPFGPVTVGNTSDQTVTVSNAGTENLVIGAVDSVAAPFSIMNDTCSGQTLVPAPALGSSCTLTVRFAPNATTTFNDSIDIPSNDPDENPVTVDVSGTGTALPVPDITVTDSVAPDNDLQVPFGDVKENTSSDQTVTVTNNGTADLMIGTVAFTDNLAAPFSIMNDNCSDTILAQSESCTITVRFAPTALGAASDTFDIPSDDPDENPVTVAVNGTGVANIPPAAPELVLPANGATGLTTSVTFEWNESPDADGDPVT